MRFSSWVDDGHLFIRGQRVAIHGDPRRGPRYQGSFEQIRMTGRTVSYSYVPARLHADTLAMLCFTLFFPWIGHTVEFPRPVSQRVVDAINQPIFRHHKGEIEVLNVGADPHVASSGTGAVRPDETVISFGGGVDSTALHAVFPEATLVYELPQRWRRRHKRSVTVDAMRVHATRSGTPVVPVRTNARHISWPTGVTNWLSLLVPALLVAIDRGHRGVLVGSNLPTMFMQAGVRYSPGHTLDHAARRTLESFTVPIVPASGGISHFAATKICADAGLTETLTFCEQGRHGAPCSQCLKCFRRETLYRILHRNDPVGYPLEAFPTDTSRYAEKYDVWRAAEEFGPGRPVSNAHNLALGRDLLGEEFPEILRHVGRDVPAAGFMARRPPEADELFPDAFRPHILNRIHDRVPEMTPDELAAFRSWDALAGSA